MKMNQHFGILYILLLICQIILCNYSPLGPYIMLSILPAMILCVPLKIGVIGCMLIAFGSGLAVDWLSEGLIGRRCPIFGKVNLHLSLPHICDVPF